MSLSLFPEYRGKGGKKRRAQSTLAMLSGTEMVSAQSLNRLGTLLYKETNRLRPVMGVRSSASPNVQARAPSKRTRSAMENVDEDNGLGEGEEAERRIAMLPFSDASADDSSDP